MSLTALGLAATFSAAAVGGYGAEVGALNGSFDSAYNLGVGARAGVAVPKLYVGLAFLHHLGTSEAGQGAGVEYASTRRVTMVGPELGYDARLSARVSLRPYLGAGYLSYARRSSVRGGSGLGATHDSSDYGLYLASGLVARAHFGGAFVGADLRVVVYPVNDPIRWAPGLFATCGYAF